ncbi:hypothetical protein [Promicromonospora sp. MEB111]|uniref:phage holin n=1 Tax=Promicromonospora sp. MEB111 TaxID=3040301 RepID=UPI002551B0C6|nr:hypothetical protein [Promicromonospora sp. MEB111]
MKLRKPTAGERRYLYGIALAAGPLLIGYGLMTAEQWPLWAALVTAVAGPGLAIANVPADE